MILSDLAKYLMTRSIAQPLCDSRATSLHLQENCCLHLARKSHHSDITVVLS